jgi:hypothetical protein
MKASCRHCAPQLSWFRPSAWLYVEENIAAASQPSPGTNSPTCARQPAGRLIRPAASSKGAAGAGPAFPGCVTIHDTEGGTASGLRKERGLTQRPSPPNSSQSSPRRLAYVGSGSSGGETTVKRMTDVVTAESRTSSSRRRGGILRRELDVRLEPKASGRRSFREQRGGCAACAQGGGGLRVRAAAETSESFRSS